MKKAVKAKKAVAKKAVAKKVVAKKAPVKPAVKKAGLSFADLNQSTVYEVTKGVRNLRKGSLVRRFGDLLLSGKDLQKHNTGSFAVMTFVPSKAYGARLIAAMKVTLKATKKEYGIKG